MIAYEANLSIRNDKQIFKNRKTTTIADDNVPFENNTWRAGKYRVRASNGLARAYRVQRVCVYFTTATRKRVVRATHTRQQCAVQAIVRCRTTEEKRACELARAEPMPTTDCRPRPFAVTRLRQTRCILTTVNDVINTDAQKTKQYELSS